MMHTMYIWLSYQVLNRLINLKMFPSNAFFPTKEAATYGLLWKSDGVSLRMSLSATEK